MVIFMWAFVFDLTLPFYFLHFVTSLIFLQFLKFVVNLHTSPNESMDSTDEFSLSTQGVLSRASSRRAAASGQKVITVLPLQISNIYAKRKGIAKNIIQTLRAIRISQDIDLVAGDFNGTAWRCRSRDNISTIDEVFSDCFAYAAGPHTIVGARIHPEQLGWRLCLLPATLESE